MQIVGYISYNYIHVHTHVLQIHNEVKKHLPDMTLLSFIFTYCWGSLKVLEIIAEKEQYIIFFKAQTNEGFEYIEKKS